MIYDDFVKWLDNLDLSTVDANPITFNLSDFESDKDFAENKTYTHDQVKEMLKARRHENKMVTACL